MKVKRVIWKRIQDTDININNEGILRHIMGGTELDSGINKSWLDFFTEEELTMIEDYEEQEEELYIKESSITFDQFMKK